MRALVLGGNRYIGLQLVFELARQGHQVTLLNSHVAPMPHGARRLHGDRQQPGVLGRVLKDHRDDFDIVYDNTAYQVKDLEPLVELFRGRVQHFVFTSSVAVYKRSLIQPVVETAATHATDDPDPRKAYGIGKIQCERYLVGEYERDGFPATSLRVTHTIGPNSPLPREHAIFARMQQGRPILIPGEGFPFVHLIHVADVARLMVSIAGNPHAIGQTYNVAGPEISSVFGCVRLMGRAVGLAPDIIHVPMDIARRAHPPLLHWGEALTGGATFSVEAARRDLDWTPRFGLEAAYRDAFAWFQAEGRDRYEMDFSADDEVLARMAGSS